MKKMVSMFWSMMWVWSLVSVMKVATVSGGSCFLLTMEEVASKIESVFENKGRREILDERLMKFSYKAKEYGVKARGDPSRKTTSRSCIWSGVG